MTKKKEKVIRCKFSFDNTQLRAFCKKFNENFEKFDSATALELHHDELERRWNKLVESFENCVTEDGDSEAAEDPSEITATFDEASKLWQECRVKLIEATQSKLQPKIHESTLVESTIKVRPALNFRLVAYNHLKEVIQIGLPLGIFFKEWL